MKWGLFGGTFDPIHFGHLRCAEEILEMFELDQVFFIPAAQPPHKADQTITPYHHRERMVKSAIVGNPHFVCSDIENRRLGKSYSIETVRFFLTAGGNDITLYFIVGQDAFQEIQSWKDWQELLLLCHFVIITRPGHTTRTLSEILPPGLARSFQYDTQENGLKGPTDHYLYFRETTLLDISATVIRRKVRAGKSIRYLTPPSVQDHIREQALYKISQR